MGSTPNHVLGYQRGSPLIGGNNTCPISLLDKPNFVSHTRSLLWSRWSVLHSCQFQGWCRLSSQVLAFSLKKLAQQEWDPIHHYGLNNQWEESGWQTTGAMNHPPTQKLVIRHNLSAHGGTLGIMDKVVSPWMIFFWWGTITFLLSDERSAR
jgi:hypothetical protein